MARSVASSKTMQITIAPRIFDSVFIAGSLKLHVSGRSLLANYTTKLGILAWNFLLLRRGAVADHAGNYLNLRLPTAVLRGMQQEPTMLWLCVAQTLPGSAISTVPAILWHWRCTNRVELLLWGVV